MAINLCKQLFLCLRDLFLGVDFLFEFVSMSPSRQRSFLWTLKKLN
jgi:hypothetical protein